MGYDYDFVFDWMVKKPGTATIGDKPEEENQFYQNQANQESAAALPDNNEGQNEEQDNLEWRKLTISDYRRVFDFSKVIFS